MPIMSKAVMCFLSGPLAFRVYLQRVSENELEEERERGAYGGYACKEETLDEVPPL